MSEDLYGESGKYQIVATDEDDHRYVIFSSDDREIAEGKYRFFAQVLECEFNVSLLVNTPNFKSVELQYVEVLMG